MPIFFGFADDVHTCRPNCRQFEWSARMDISSRSHENGIGRLRRSVFERPSWSTRDRLFGYWLLFWTPTLTSATIFSAKKSTLEAAAVKSGLFFGHTKNACTRFFNRKTDKTLLPMCTRPTRRGITMCHARDRRWGKEDGRNTTWIIVVAEDRSTAAMTRRSMSIISRPRRRCEHAFQRGAAAVSGIPRTTDYVIRPVRQFLLRGGGGAGVAWMNRRPSRCEWIIRARAGAPCRFQTTVVAKSFKSPDDGR